MVSESRLSVVLLLWRWDFHSPCKTNDPDCEHSVTIERTSWVVTCSEIKFVLSVLECQGAWIL